MKIICRWVLALALVLLVTACSSTTFVYNRLATLAPWYFNGFVDLDLAQRQQLRELVAEYLQTHRSEELPRYVDLLAEASGLLDGDVASEDLARLYGEAEKAAERLQDGVLAWLLVLGAGLSDEQVHDFIDTLRERQAEYETEFLERDEQQYRDDISDSLLRNTRRFMGRLTREQQVLLATASSQLIRTDEQWLTARSAWIDSLEQLLTQRQPGWEDQVRALAAQRLERDAVANNPVNAHNVTVIADNLAAVINSRTDRQDRHLRRELNRWQSDLRQLIAEGGNL